MKRYFVVFRIRKHGELQGEGNTSVEVEEDQNFDIRKIQNEIGNHLNLEKETVMITWFKQLEEWEV